MKKIFVSVSVILIFCMIFVSCADGKDSTSEATTDNFVLTDDNNPVAVIEMEDGGIMKIELFMDSAPNTVKNFVYLAKNGFYDGLIFHRVIPGFMIQGGDPNGNGTGGPGYNIVGEFTNNGFDNNKKNSRGYVAMARKGNPYNPSSAYNTAGSQFYINVADNPSLDGDYAVFGYCFEGMDVADSIVSQKTDANDKPVNDIVIKSITIVSTAENVEEPETLM